MAVPSTGRRPLTGKRPSRYSDDTRRGILSDSELAAQIARLSDQNGGDREGMRILMEDNRKLRDSRREQDEYIEDLEARVPAEGSVAVPKEDADLLPKFKALGKSPEEITTALTERDTFKASVDATSLEKSNGSAATLLQWNADALNEILALKGKVIEMRDVATTVDGKIVKTPTPHIRDAKGKPGEGLEPLAEVAERDWKPLLGALKAVAGNEDSSNAGAMDTPFIPQSGVGTARQQPTKTVDQVRKTLDNSFADVFPKAASTT